MPTDLVSVLIPAYNVAKYLGRCLRSVLRQTYANLEIVVVDDGSTDGTYAVAQKYAAQDPRVVLYQKPNQNNIALTRNFLLAHCHGKYCVWVDSDDRVQPKYVEKLYQALVTNHADLSICGYRLQLLPGPILPPLRRRTYVYPADTMAPRMVFRTGFVLWNKMYRADLLRGTDAVQFDPTLTFGEDFWFNLAYLRRCQKVACLNEKLYRYSFRSGSEIHKKFGNKHVGFINALLAQCVQETNPVLRDTMRAWAAFSCCGFVFLANQKQYPLTVHRMKHFANQYRCDLYHNRLANFGLKFILWVGLKTWCRPRKKR